MYQITTNVAMQAGVVDENAPLVGKTALTDESAPSSSQQQHQTKRQPLQSVNGRIKLSKKPLSGPTSSQQSEPQNREFSLFHPTAQLSAFTSLSDQLRYSSLLNQSQSHYDSSSVQEPKSSRETFTVYSDAESQPSTQRHTSQTLPLSNLGLDSSAPSTSVEQPSDEPGASQSCTTTGTLELLAQLQPRTLRMQQDDINRNFNDQSESSACSPHSRRLHELDAVKTNGGALFDTTMDSVKSFGSPMSIQSAGSAQKESVRSDRERPLGAAYSDERARTGFDDDDAPTAFESAPAGDDDELFSSTYFTAPPISEKEAHLDYVLAVPEYVDGLFQYLREREQLQRPQKDYMRKQSDLNNEMRAVLVDWLVDVGVEYQMQLVGGMRIWEFLFMYNSTTCFACRACSPSRYAFLFHQETIFLTVRYVDLTLSARTVPRARLQLVGTSACLLAAKYEEIYPPEVNEFVYITDDTYSKDEVLRMERSLLRDVLHFNCSLVTPLVFVTYFAKVCRADGRTRQLANMLCELTLLETQYLAFLPSQIAGAAMCLANLMTGPIPWPEELENAADMDIMKIYPCMKLMLESFKAAPSGLYRAIYNKYSEPNHHSVAMILPPDEIPPIEDTDSS